MNERFLYVKDKILLANMRSIFRGRVNNQFLHVFIIIAMR